MKAGYTIENRGLSISSRRIMYVLNWEFKNHIDNVFLSMKCKYHEDMEDCIGRWQPKGTKEKQLK